MKMMRLFLALLCCATGALSTSNSSTPRIIVIGSGPAGVGAATRLLENGFTDVTVLEAENRIGGRVYSDYMVDMGGQWVTGEKNNVAFELAWPLGLIERFEDNHNFTMKFIGSSGSSLSDETSTKIRYQHMKIEEDINNTDILKTPTFGEYAEPKFLEYFKTLPEINPDIYNALLYAMNKAQMASDAANSWHDVSLKGLRDYPLNEGDIAINWKNRTYSTILDILMKKIPDPEKELPLMDKTHLNTKVTKIDYSGNSAPVKVSTADGKEYLADHVIFTPSLGVLKANYEKLFNPPLPEKKVTAIKNIGFGHTAKIMLYYENPWWFTNEYQYYAKFLYWTDADRKEIENDPKRRWMLGVISFNPIEFKPNVLLCWVSSNYSTEMELVPEELFRSQILGLIDRFLGKDYNITQPKEIIRTMWNTNENFRGTYSYLGVEVDVANVSAADLAEPIIRNDKPVLQFAGEATNKYFGTVHGAIESGWREADRIKNLYPNKKSSKN